MYFLYRHIRLDTNKPFYIGIGKRRFRGSINSDYERAFVKKNRTNHWKNIVNKTNYNVEIMFESDDVNVIFEKEKEFISLYGRIDLGLGTLVNLTDGGDGGFNRTNEQKIAISKRMLGNKNGVGSSQSEQNKKIISERFRGNTTWVGKKHKESSKQLISSAKKNICLSESHRQNTINTKPNSKQVICLNNNIKYKSICECVRLLFKYNTLVSDVKFRNYKNKISHVCNGKLNNYKGYKFKFV